MAVISSVVLGADVGVVAYGLSASLLAALLAGTAAGTVLMFATARYQWGRWCVASSAPARTSALSAGPADLSVRLARTPSESQRRSMTCTSLILSGTTRNEEILNPRPPMRLPGHGSVCAIHTVVMTAERSGWGQSGERWARGVSRGGDDARSVPKITAGLGQRTLAAAAG
jgi:hypothetical protein